MSGWFLSFNNTLPERAEKFRKAFTFPHLPQLQLQFHELSSGVSLAFWNWRNDGRFHDIALVKDENGYIILEGYLTGAGKFGNIPGETNLAAERILQLWRQHGEALIPELNGSFTLCFLPIEGKEATLFTDRFNSRPAWYSIEADTTTFANFATPLASMSSGTNRFDPAALWSLLCYSRPVGFQSLFSGIKYLKAGTKALVKDGRFEKQEKWYRLHYSPNPKNSSNDWAQAIVERLKTSAANMNESAPELYLFLSGGLDSRVAAGALGDKAASITLASHINMNVKLSQQVAEAVGMEHEIFYRDDYDYLNYLDVAAALSNGTYNLAHAHFMRPCAVKTEQKPLSSFILGDLLENFNKHYYRHLPEDPSELSPSKLPEIFKILYGYTHPDLTQLRALFKRDVAKELEVHWKKALINWAEDVTSVSEDERDFLDSLFRWYNNYGCPTNLMLECIKPFAPHRNLMFDNELLNLLQQMPSSIKSKGVMHNKILTLQNKRLVKIADSNFWLPPSTPKPIKEFAQQVRPLLGKWRRRLNKKGGNGKPNFRGEGSWHMRHEWFKHDEKYQNLVKDLIEDESIFMNEIFDRQSIRKSWAEFLAGNKSRNFEWDMLISYGLVQKQFPSSGIAF